MNVPILKFSDAFGDNVLQQTNTTSNTTQAQLLSIEQNMTISRTHCIFSELESHSTDVTPKGDIGLQGASKIKQSDKDNTETYLKSNYYQDCRGIFHLNHWLVLRSQLKHLVRQSTKAISKHNKHRHSRCIKTSSI